jgi:hypothetical protein
VRRVGAEKGGTLLIKLTLAIAAAALCMLTAELASSQAAGGWSCCVSYGTFQGYTAPGQGGDGPYDDLCSSAVRISADQTPGGYYSTVALIDRNGGWRRSSRSTAVNVYAFVSPDTLDGALAYSKKAHCNNSSNATVYFITCAASEWRGFCA